MSIADTRLNVMVFPQRWDGARLHVRALVFPVGNPLQPLAPGQPSFANATIKLNAHLIPSLERLPLPADVTAQAPLNASTPPTANPLFHEMSDVFEIDPAATSYTPPAAKTHFKKLVMPSYLLRTGFDRPRTPFAVTDNSYVCAIVDGQRPKPVPKPPAPPKWEPVLAMALRQPLLAERLGLLFRSTIDLPVIDFFSEGGWIYVALDPSSDYAAPASITPDFVRLHAARVPPLAQGAGRVVFAPILFPVRPIPPSGSFDELLREAELYDDGFARIVHAYQQERADMIDRGRQGAGRARPYTDHGIRLGWDDEQIVVWLNRQLTDDPRNNPTAARDTPMGVRGFRVDVRDAEGAQTWSSLVRMEGALTVGSTPIGTFQGEMGVELAPSQLQGAHEGEYWLPPYFTQWGGGSLMALDETAVRVAGNTPSPRLLTPVGEHQVPLKYGHNYDFRVRLMDLTGGGPRASDPFPEATPTATTRCVFRRFVPPGRVRVGEPIEQDGGATLVYEVSRPRLGYPTLVYTNHPNPEQVLLADAPAAKAEGREASHPDPDVALLRIDISVGGLEFDSANIRNAGEPRRHLYTTTRAFPVNPLTPLELSLTFGDTPDVAGFPAPVATGDILIPTARDVYIALTPIARVDPALAASGISDPALADRLDGADLDLRDPNLAYFGNQAARVGSAMTFIVRREASDESDLLVEMPDRPFQALMLQPDPAADARLAAERAAAGQQDQAPDSVTQRFARQLRLNTSDLVFTGRSGRRTVFGCSAAVRHLLSPDHGVLTVASKAELCGQWIVAVSLRIQRDWTWDGLDNAGFEIFRRVNGGSQTLVGRLSLRRSINATALKPAPAVDRSTTDVLFLDGIDPKAQPGAFPSEIVAEYSVVPRFRGTPASDVPWTQSIRLPIAAPPVQVPRLVSAGIALSPYGHDERYTSTYERRRVLWLEFAEPVAAPGDAYFARVLAHAADPMLSRDDPNPPPGPFEPPINLDPEPIRAIIPGQPPDASGLDAMQRLIESGDGSGSRCFLLPLPAGLVDASPELFGFFVYEIRVGHDKGWSTAQARYGSALRLTGVQHPPPPMQCSVSRTASYIRVSAPFASPVAAGHYVRADLPRSDLWGLLYVQVRQADGLAWRNVLLARTRLRFSEEEMRGRGAPEPHGFGYWDHDHVVRMLETIALPGNSPLSVVVVELLPELDSPFPDPLGRDLGHVRILRASTLTPVPPICVDEPAIQ